MTKFQEVHLRAALKRDQMKPAYRYDDELVTPDGEGMMRRGRPRQESLEQGDSDEHSISNNS
jgi:hypothetical protein